MAIEERFVAVISARDQASATLRAIGAQFSAISRQTGMTRLAASVGGVTRALGGLARSAVAVAGPMAAVTGAAAAVGLVSITARTVAAAGAISDLSARTGIAVRDLEELGDAARLAGVEEATLASSLQRLNRGMAEAATGGNAELASVFRQLGISMRDSNGEIRAAADTLPELANAFQRTENQALRVTLATALFGRQGEALIPMLANGSAALERSRERIRQYGFSMADTAESLASIDDVFETLQVATNGLTRAIGAQLAPILGPIAQGMADWVRANRDLIATGIGDWVRRLTESFQEFFADRGPLERLDAFATQIGAAVEAVGGIRNVLIGFGALAAAPFIAALVSIGAAFVPLGVALGSFALALGAASPIGLAVIAFGAMAALLISNWEPAAAFFAGLWDRIAGIFAAAWERIRPIVEAVSSAVSAITGGSSPTGAVAAPEAQAARRVNQRAGGRTGFDPDTGALLRSPMAAPQGQVEVTVNIANAPPGTRVEAESSGALVQRPSTNVGYSMGRAPR